MSKFRTFTTEHFRNASMTNIVSFMALITGLKNNHSMAKIMNNKYTVVQY